MFQSFSPNMLKTFEQCPKKFHFKYVKKIGMPMNDDIFEFGKNIHAIASYYLRKENITKMEESLTEEEKKIWFYLKNIEYFSYETINTEYNLSFKLEKIFFGGGLDALVKKGDTYYVLDYKTGAVPKKSVYDFQTMIYLLAVREFFKTDKVVFIYIDLRNKKEVQINLTKDLVKEYEEKLLITIGKIKNEEFTKRLKDCSCEYNIICF